jgi:hypothetical protein
VACAEPTNLLGVDEWATLAHAFGQPNTTQLAGDPLSARVRHDGESVPVAPPAIPAHNQRTDEVVVLPGQQEHAA